MATRFLFFNSLFLKKCIICVMQVKVENFEGPIGLLLDLIEKKKMPISDISLAEISGQFLDHIKTFENFPRADTARFIETASILILIKSRALLPNMEIDDEDNQSIDDLERRLIIYKLIRESSEAIKSFYGKTPMFQRESFANAGVVFIKPANLSLENIVESIKNLINCLPKEEKLPELKVGKTIKLEEKISELAERIQNNIQTCFYNFSRSGSCGASLSKEELNEIKTEIIVSFLALLELVRQGMAMAVQENPFGDINIQKSENLI